MVDFALFLPSTKTLLSDVSIYRRGIKRLQAHDWLRLSLHKYTSDVYSAELF